jgi:hypothetical protein
LFGGTVAEFAAPRRPQGSLLKRSLDDRALSVQTSGVAIDGHPSRMESRVDNDSIVIDAGRRSGGSTRLFSRRPKRCFL